MKSDLIIVIKNLINNLFFILSCKIFSSFPKTPNPKNKIHKKDIRIAKFFFILLNFKNYSEIVVVDLT